MTEELLNDSPVGCIFFTRQSTGTIQQPDVAVAIPTRGAHAQSQGI